MTLLSVLALALLALSGLLLDWHRRAWIAAKSSVEIDPRELRAARAQYLRRLRASGLIGVIGALLMVRPLVPEKPLWFTLYLLLLVTLCGWMLLLALVDTFATSLRLRRVRQETESLQSKLERELRAARERSEDQKHL